MSDQRERCKERVPSPGMIGRYRNCSRYAVKDGYCKQHHPESVERRNNASAERYRAQLEQSPWRKLERLREINLELLAALEAAVESGMVPTSSVKDGGASKYSKQVRVADQIRAAIAKATGEEA